MSTQRVLGGHSDTWALRGHLDTQGALGRHSKGTRALVHFRHSGTRALRVLGHLTTNGTQALGHSDTWALETLYLADSFEVV